PPGLEAKKLSHTHLRAVAPDKVWLSAEADGKPYVARFDGRTWTYVAPPPDLAPSDLSAARDGSAWILSRKGPLLWRATAAGSWAKAVLDGAAKLREDALVRIGVYGASADDAWLGASTPVVPSKDDPAKGERSMIFRTKKGTQVKVQEPEPLL